MASHCSPWSLRGAVKGGLAFGWKCQGNGAFPGYAAAGVVPFAYSYEDQGVYALLAVQRGKKRHEYSLPGGKIKAVDQRDPRRTAAREAHEETHGLLSEADILAALTRGGGDLFACSIGGGGSQDIRGSFDGQRAQGGKTVPGRYFTAGRYALFPLHLPFMWQLPAACAQRLAAGQGHPEAAKVLGLSWLSLENLTKLRDQRSLQDPHSGTQTACNEFIARTVLPQVCEWLRQARDDIRRHAREASGAAGAGVPSSAQAPVAVSAGAAAACKDSLVGAQEDALLGAFSGMRVRD